MGTFSWCATLWSPGNMVRVRVPANSWSCTQEPWRKRMKIVGVLQKSPNMGVSKINMINPWKFWVVRVLTRHEMGNAAMLTPQVPFLEENNSPISQMKKFGEGIRWSPSPGSSRGHLMVAMGLHPLGCEASKSETCETSSHFSDTDRDTHIHLYTYIGTYNYTSSHFSAFFLMLAAHHLYRLGSEEDILRAPQELESFRSCSQVSRRGSERIQGNIVRILKILKDKQELRLKLRQLFVFF